MLIFLLSVVSAGASVAGCVWNGSFSDGSWLWLLPLGFVGGVLILGALALALFALCCLAVDLSKPQTKDSPFFRRMACVYIDAIVRLFCIRIHTRGMEQLPKDGRFLLVCNHLNDTDPAVLLHQFRKTPLAFITKWENFKKPFVAQIMHKTLCQSINRENDRQALKTIMKCVSLLKEDRVSVAVFPEGYVSTDKKLHPLRYGVFKIALRSNVPVVVCTLRNTHHIFSNMRRLKPTDVQLHLVGVIPPEQLQGTTATAVGKRVYEMMAADLGPDLVAGEDA